MKHFILILLFIYNSVASLAQNSNDTKPAANFSSIDSLTGLGDDRDMSISNDGIYFSYAIVYHHLSSWRSLPRKKLIVQSIFGNWKREFTDSFSGFFSFDSKQYIFKRNDTLIFLKLGTDEYETIPGVLSYTQFSGIQCNWVFYQLKNDSKTLIAHDLWSGKEFKFNSVVDYSVNTKGNVLLYKMSNKTGTLTNVSLNYLSLKDGRTIEIWSTNSDGSSLKDYTIDPSGKQVALTVQTRVKGRNNASIWYYKYGMDKAILKISDHSPGIEQGLSVRGGLSFINGGSYIKFSLQENQDFSNRKREGPSVDVWNYKDTILQSTQLYETAPKIYPAVTNSEGDSVVQLLHPYEKIVGLGKNFAVVQKDFTGDRFWEPTHQKGVNFIRSLSNGKQQKLTVTSKFPNFNFSPDGNYLVYPDGDRQCNYFSLDLRTGKLTNISSSLQPYRLAFKDDFDRSNIKPTTDNTGKDGIAAWLQDSSLLVYDRYDIWKLDVTGKKKPVNVTNNYGRQHHIKLRLLEMHYADALPKDAELSLIAFNTQNKNNGFYIKELNKIGDPKSLFMGPFVFFLSPFYLSRNPNDYDQGMKPLKALNTNIWIVKRQSSTEAPNYFLTKDFKNYTALTSLCPHSNYNWLQAELVSFKQVDGTMSQGVLYKPENFQPDKKYPVLINYYQQLSHRLNEYPVLDYTESAHINIPWFVSHGYLVFTPDIYFMSGKSGQSAWNTVVGAAKHLGKLKFVNANRIGISGHSFAGGLTNYILTHSKMFAAVLEGAGVSDNISDALQLAGKDFKEASRLAHAEEQRPSIWDQQQLWLSASPILSADKVKSPLLIFHCKLDGGVPWQNGLELFTALRRLNKRVWMLQYDGEGHSLIKKDNEKDFTIRVNQFFDHYLKQSPAPKWMTTGIPARLKGIENGYELESTSKKD